MVRGVMGWCYLLRLDYEVEDGNGACYCLKARQLWRRGCGSIDWLLVRSREMRISSGQSISHLYLN